MFERAIRLKLRFNYRGIVTPEDLWDIPVTKNEHGEYISDLDFINDNLMKEKEASRVTSLFGSRSQTNDILDLKINIVKYIAETKLAELKENENKLLKKERKQKMLAIIAAKQDKELEEMEIDDLKKLVEEL